MADQFDLWADPQKALVPEGPNVYSTRIQWTGAPDGL